MSLKWVFIQALLCLTVVTFICPICAKTELENSINENNEDNLIHYSTEEKIALEKVSSKLYCEKIRPTAELISSK
jgi:hypothetical protein